MSSEQSIDLQPQSMSLSAPDQEGSFESDLYPLSSWRERRSTRPSRRHRVWRTGRSVRPPGATRNKTKLPDASIDSLFDPLRCLVGVGVCLNPRVRGKFSARSKSPGVSGQNCAVRVAVQGGIHGALSINHRGIMPGREIVVLLSWHAWWSCGLWYWRTGDYDLRTERDALSFGISWRWAGGVCVMDAKALFLYWVR